MATLTGKKTIKTSKGKESVSQTVARAKAMLSQTKAQGATPFKGSSYEKAYNNSVITSDSLQPMPKLNLPTPPAPKDPGPISLTNTPALTDAGFTATDAGYTFTQPPLMNDSLDASNARQNQTNMAYLQSVLNNKPVNGEADYAKMEKKAGISKLQSRT
jgi:hypothetical protein